MKVSLLVPLAASVVLTAAFSIPEDNHHNQLILDHDDHHEHEPLKDFDPHHHDDHKEEPGHEGHPGGRGKCNRDPLRKGWLLNRPPLSAEGTHIDLASQEAFNVLRWARSSRDDSRVRDRDLWFMKHYHLARHHGRKDKNERPEDYQMGPISRHDEDEWAELDDGPGKKPSHGPPRWHPPVRPPVKTIWEIISTSNHTTNFTHIISDFPDLVGILNSTSLTDKYTLFVPTDKTFEKFKDIPKDKKPPKEVIKKVLTYHLSHDFYPTFRLLLGHTIPSSIDSEELGGPQRLRVGLGPHGLTVNFYSTIVAANIFAKNGVVHAVDNLLFPPPPAWRIISLLPAEFSTFILGLHLTNLTTELHGVPHQGGTLFAPPNSAFKALGPRVNAFLFSPWGRKYLKCILQYHIVFNETLYSDAYYHPTIEEGTLGVERATEIPKGKYHIDLPTLLKGKHLSIDISRFGGLISIVLNGAARVKVQDGIAKDGVIQVVDRVLIPPRKPPRNDESDDADEFEGYPEESKEWRRLENGWRDGGAPRPSVADGGSLFLSVEEFKKRFEGLVGEDEDDVKAMGEYREEDIIAMWDE